MSADAAIPPNPRIKRRGFGSMTLEQRTRIASLGGKEAHRRGVGHRWTPEEAQEAGRAAVGQASPTGSRLGSERSKARCMMAFI